MLITTLKTEILLSFTRKKLGLAIELYSDSHNKKADCDI